MRVMRFVFLFCAAFLFSSITPQLVFGADIDVRTVVFPTTQQPVTAQLFAAQGDTKRPAVIILHGASGIDAFREFYQGYARAIARSGIDAYLLSYYDDAEFTRVQNHHSVEDIQTTFDNRCRAWSSLVSDVVGKIMSQDQSSGQIGLLGFSQGGFLATAVAVQDKHISALVVFYGGIPSILQSKITRLPPLLELHGDADQVVPLREGQALVELAHRLRQSGEIVVYPGAKHGFNGTDSTDAERRTLAFLQKQLRIN